MSVPTPKTKNPAAVALGKLGGRKGGIARSQSLTPARRSEIGKKAARMRWTKARIQKSLDDLVVAGELIDLGDGKYRRARGGAA